MATTTTATYIFPHHLSSKTNNIPFTHHNNNNNNNPLLTRTFSSAFGFNASAHLPNSTQVNKGFPCSGVGVRADLHPSKLKKLEIFSDKQILLRLSGCRPSLVESWGNAAKCSGGSRKGVRVLAQLSAPLIGPSDTWGTWAVLLCAGTFGTWSEKTRWGSTLSGALVSTLVGLLASNIGLVASDAAAYSVVNTYLLPLAVPLLLYAADMNRVLASTGKLLVAFSIGSVTTIIGTFVALKVVPLSSLGQDGWKIASALMSRHIGGAVNYVAVSEALGASSTIVASGLAADNLICAVYFTTLFTLASSIPPEASQSRNEGEEHLQTGTGSSMHLLEGSMGLALSALICMAGVGLAKFLRIRGGGIPCITALVVLLATIFPVQIGKLAPSAECLAAILLQIFFATIGASGDVGAVITTAPSLFLFSFVQIAVHLILILGIGKFFNFELRQLLLASNANVGGPTTVAGMANAKGWKSLVVPGILTGIFGVAIATFLSIVLGLTVLRYL